MKSFKTFFIEDVESKKHYDNLVLKVSGEFEKKFKKLKDDYELFQSEVKVFEKYAESVRKKITDEINKLVETYVKTGDESKRRVILAETWAIQLGNSIKSETTRYSEAIPEFFDFLNNQLETHKKVIGTVKNELEKILEKYTKEYERKGIMKIKSGTEIDKFKELYDESLNEGNIKDLYNDIITKGKEIIKNLTDFFKKDTDEFKKMEKKLKALGLDVDLKRDYHRIKTEYYK